jgi:hypothetical protein
MADNVLIILRLGDSFELYLIIFTIKLRFCLYSLELLEELEHAG